MVSFMAPVPVDDGVDEADRFQTANPDIEVIELLLPDTNGVFRGKWIPTSHLRGLYRDGVALAKSAFALDIWGNDVTSTGLYHEVGDRDGTCRPVPGTLKRVPWAERPTAQVLLSMDDEDGAPFFADPRNLLAGVVDRLKAHDLTPVTAFELEFYLLPTPGPGTYPRSATPAGGPDRTNIYSLTDLSDHADLFAEIETAAKHLDVSTDTIISEAAPGQFEINLNHVGDPFAAADQAVMLRRIIRQTAERHGLTATFMAKPFPHRAGNGMHAHVSLVDGSGTNIFSRAGDGEAQRKRAVAGLLHTMADASLIFISSYNGFRRLAGPYSPAQPLWAENNRYVAVRLPRAKPAARRFEHRVAGADANPYLVLAAILGGAVYGLETDLPLRPAVEGDIGAVSAERLPQTLQHALDAFSASAWIGDTLGPDWQSFYAKVKRQELEGFDACISPLEYDTYL